MDLSNRTVLVTGGSGGIGSEICRRFASMGARVWVHYSGNQAAATATLESLADGEHMTIQADLRDATAVASMMQQVFDSSGRLDILVNNAGIFERHPPMNTSYDEWQAAWTKTLGINLLGAANTCHLAAQHMAEQGGGRIINITSRGAFRGEPECPAYGASKAGLNALSQSLAVALAPQGIHVIAIAPGFVETAMARPYLTGEAAQAIKNQSPLGRVATTADVAYWVTCAAADEAAFATGTIIDVNGASYLRS